jgi:WD40 repeat protein
MLLLENSFHAAGKVVTSIQFTGNGQKVAICTESGVISVYQTQNWKLLREFRGLPSPLTQMGWTHDSARIYSGCGSRRFASCDMASGKCRAVPMTQPANICAVACCASKAGAIFGCSDGLIIVPDRYMRRFRDVQGHAGLITCVAFHPDTEHAVSAALDGMVRIWNLQRMLCERSVYAGARVSCLAFSPSHEHVLARSIADHLAMLRWPKLEKTATFRGHVPGTGLLQCGFVCASGDRAAWDVFASNGDGRVEIWGTNDNSEDPVVSEELHDAPFVAIHPHPLGQMIVTGSLGGDSRVKVWKVRQHDGQPDG